MFDQQNQTQTENLVDMSTSLNEDHHQKNEEKIVLNQTEKLQTKKCIPKVKIHERKIYPCTKCDIKFFKQQELTFHMTESHSTIIWITCKKCNLKYKHQSSFNRHKPKCSKFQQILKGGNKNSFPFQRYYNQYTKTCDTQKNNDKSCSNEGQMVTSLSENHNQRNEEDNIPNETEKQAFVQNPHFISKVSTCEIDMCGEQTQTEKLVEITGSEGHYQRHEWNNVPQIMFNQNSSFKLSNAETESYICNLCGMRQTSHLALHKHTNLHSVNKRHMCKHPTCNMQFYHLLLLRDHLCVEHPEFKQFVCGYCSKWFQMKGTLKKHIELFHMQ